MQRAEFRGNQRGRCFDLRGSGAMLIWVCDACGHAEETSPIVGNELAYADLGFGSYGAPVDGMQDFCGDCLKKVHDALSAFEQERLSRQPEYFAERGGGDPRRGRKNIEPVCACCRSAACPSCGERKFAESYHSDTTEAGLMAIDRRSFLIGLGAAAVAAPAAARAAGAGLVGVDLAAGFDTTTVTIFTPEASGVNLQRFFLVRKQAEDDLRALCATDKRYFDAPQWSTAEAVLSAACSARARLLPAETVAPASAPAPFACASAKSPRPPRISARSRRRRRA